MSEVVLKAEAVLAFLGEIFKRQDNAVLTKADFEVLSQGFASLWTHVPEHDTVPVINTGHLTEETCRLLWSGGMRTPWTGSAVPYDEGLFYACGGVMPNMPDDLKKVEEWAAKHDVQWIRFDSEARFAPDLPAYEWEAEMERLEAADRYLLWTEGDVDPSLHGPYHSDEARVEAARRFRDGPAKEDGLYRLDVTCGAKVLVNAFTGEELESSQVTA